jgi:phosphoglycolate phosphatase
MSFKLPKCVLFDLDGTLLDSLPGIAFSVAEACRTVGLPAREINLRSLIGPPIRTIFSRALETQEAELLDRLEKAFRISYDSEGWQKTPCYPGAREVLQQMRAAGRRLFVVSNKPRHISIRILEREGVLGLMELVYTRDSRVPAYASKQEMLGILLEEHQLRPCDCVMIGDTMEDVTASAANGIEILFMEHGYGEALPTHPIRLRLRSFYEFQPMLATEIAE